MRVLIKGCHFGVACLGRKSVASRPGQRKRSFQPTVKNTAWHTTAKRIFSVSITTLGRRPHRESGLTLSLMCSLWHNAFPAPCLNAFANCRLWTLIRSEASKRRQNPRCLKQHRFQSSMLNRLHSTLLWHWGGTAVTACVAPGQIPTNRKEADKLPPAKENGINASQNRPVLGESLFMELPPTRRLHQVPARAVLVIFFSHSNWPNFTYNSRPLRGPVMTRRSWPRHTPFHMPTLHP